MARIAPVLTTGMPVSRRVVLPSEDRPSPRRTGAGPFEWVRRYDYVFFAAFLMLPSLIWVASDQSAWAWDAATYGESSVDLYYHLRNDPGHWLRAMQTVYPSRAPGILWFGQFFVPLGQLLGSIDVGLLLSILVCQWVTLVLVYRTGRELFPQLGRSGLLAGCLLVGSAPIFVGMSHCYMTEAVQILGVAWIFHTAACCSRWDRLQTATHLIAAGSVVLLSKVTTPAYCFLPGLIALVSLGSRRQPGQSTTGRHPFARWLAFAASLVLCTATLAWYGKNVHAACSLAYSSAVGTHSAFYGHSGTVWDKLHFWFDTFQTAILTQASFGCVTGLCLAGVGAGLVRRSRPNLVVAAAFLQVGVFFGLAAVSRNENSRFLSPLLPAAAVGFMAALAALGSARCGYLFAAIFVAQWGWVNVLSMTVPGDPTPVNSAHGVHVHRPLTDPVVKREAERLVSLIADDPDGAWHLHMVGVEDWRLNAAGLNYIALKEQLQTHRRPYFATLDYPPTGDREKVCQHFVDMKAGYFVTLSDEQINVDSFNHLSIDMALHLAEDARYARQSWPSDFGVIVYRRRSAE